MFLQELAEHLPRLYLLKIGDDLIARTKSEIDHRLEFLTMARVPDGLVIEFADLAEKGVRQRRCAAAGLKSLERRKAFKRKAFDLGHRFDRRDLAVAYHACRLDIFIDQPFDREDELVVQRRLRILRQASDADVNFLDRVEFRRSVHRQYGNHAGSEAAIWDNVDAGGSGIRVECELLIDDVIV